jgi:hypothetical protein
MLPLVKFGNHLYQHIKPKLHKSHYPAIELILEQGTLATRVLKSLKKDPSEKNIISVYSQLQDCLQGNTLFQP